MHKKQDRLPLHPILLGFTLPLFLAACGGGGSSDGPKATTPEVGDACDASFADTCGATSGRLVCTNNVVAAEACGAGESCTGGVCCPSIDNATASASGGSCAYSCNSGFDNTGTAAAPVCVASSSGGGSTGSCPAQPHATGVEENGSCVYTCVDGYVNDGSSAAPNCQIGQKCEMGQILRRSGNTDWTAAAACPPGDAGRQVCYQATPDTPAECVDPKAEFVFKMRWTPDDEHDALPFGPYDRGSGLPSSIDVDCDSDGEFEGTDLTSGQQVDCHATAPIEITVRGYFKSLNFGGSYLYSSQGGTRKLCFSDAIEVIQWGKNPWFDMINLFYGCKNVSFAEGIDPPNLVQTNSLRWAFAAMSGFSGDISNWDVSQVKSTYQMAAGSPDFNADISGWNVSNVTDMREMFLGATAFNQDLSKWDVSKVTNMRRMFEGAEAFTQDISGWEVGAVTDMYSMFAGALRFNQDISGWDVSKVTDMGRMFNGASSFSQDISGWDLSSVRSCSESFYAGSALSPAQVPEICR